jgi:Zn-dependent peptidase ImmA (M78 family)
MNINIPIDLDNILTQWRDLRVSIEDIDGAGYFVDLGVRGGEILIRRNDHPARQRFTLAHEVGHWLLSRASAEATATLSRAAIEKWCDEFAANILMPPDLVRAHFRDARLSGLVRAIQNGPKAFSVSDQAFRLQVNEVTPLKLFLAAINDNDMKITYSYDKRRDIPAEAQRILGSLGNRWQDEGLWRLPLATVVRLPVDREKSSQWLIGIIWRRHRPEGHLRQEPHDGEVTSPCQDSETSATA